MTLLSPTQAHDLLGELEQISNKANPARSPLPWGVIIFAGVFLGIGLALAQLGNGWGVLIALCALPPGLYLEYRRSRRVRFAIKQPVAPEPKQSWKNILIFLVIYSLVFFSLNMLPQGNIPLAIALGITVTLATICGFALYYKKGIAA